MLDPVTTVIAGPPVSLAIELGSIALYFLTRKAGESFKEWKLRRKRQKSQNQH